MSLALSTTAVVSNVCDLMYFFSMTCERHFGNNISWELAELILCFLGDGMQGFQTPIIEESLIVDNVGVLGNVHSERGLTYVEVELAGHM